MRYVVEPTPTGVSHNRREPLCRDAVEIHPPSDVLAWNPKPGRQTGDLEP